MEAGATPTTIASLIGVLTQVVQFLIDQVGTVFGIISEHPIALIWVGVSLGFVAVKFAKYILGM